MPASGWILQVSGPTTRYRGNSLDIGVIDGALAVKPAEELKQPQHSGVPQCVWLHALQLQELSDTCIV